MLLNLQQLIDTYHMRIKGIIHVGAHFGQEYPLYRDLGIPNIVFIEPCKNAYHKLRHMLLEKKAKNVITFNVACGADFDTGLMYTEKANMGQSNSLLQPALHAEQYPHIDFQGRETVDIVRLDSLNIDIHDYNMLVIDVQGYELKVLRGAVNFLPRIKYICTEVNRAELYKGCAQVTDLDAYLSEYSRVETTWPGNTWGDALYIHKSKLKTDEIFYT